MNLPDFPYARTQFPLAPSTLYHLGGPAAVALLPRDEAEMREAYAWMLRQEAPKLILGGGSNVLIADEGFPGVVLFTTELKRKEDLGGGRYFISSGIYLDEVILSVMLPRNYTGVGALTGIPGSVGGALYMNAGTANGTVCDFVESVEVLNPSGQFSVPVDASMYGYRRQTFCAQGDVILGGLFRFSRAEEDQRAIHAHYVERRRAKQPQGHCCGSVFKNPEGGHAGQLIEACGLKGARRGGAIISEMHANFIMNEDNASFDDILGLIELAKAKVREQSGVRLEEEVRIIAPGRGGY